MHEQIQNWLNSKSRDFNKGLDLYHQASKNRSVYLYLVRKQDKAKLVYELEKLLSILPKKAVETKIGNDTPVDTSDKGKEVILTPEKDKVNRENLPEDLRKIYDEISEKYKHQRAAHERMKLEEVNDEIRAKAREEVVKLDEEIAAGWQLINEYLEKKKAEETNTGTAPVTPVVTPAPEATTPPVTFTPEAKDPLLIMKEVNAARKFISINVDKVSSLEGTPKEVMVKKLRERYATLVSLKAEIDPETIDKLIKAGAGVIDCA